MEIVASQTAGEFTETEALDPALEQAAAEGRYLRIRDWTSQYLSAPRDLFLYLPEAYLHEPDRRFPVLLLHYGQNLFDGKLSYVRDHTWRAGATADAEVVAGRVQPVILAGIANTGAERMAEYTPTSDRRLGGGKGLLYARLLIDELLPMLSADLRILPGPENTGIAGSSLGGLISLAIAMRYPQVFGRAGVLSPSVWWNDCALLRDVRSLKQKLPLRIWLDIGLAEGPRHVRDTDLLAQLLEKKGWRADSDLKYRRFPDAVHSEDAWADRFGEVLRFLFPAAG